MVKYTISESALKEFSEKKEAKDKEDRAAEEEQQASSGGERTKSPSSLNARRKIRKFISGDNNEPVDELEVIGYQEEVDVSLLFEATGVFYAHFNCALWSAGVSKSKWRRPPRTPLCLSSSMSQELCSRLLGSNVPTVSTMELLLPAKPASASTIGPVLLPLVPSLRSPH
jgi:hypothetical protein